jgi:hypothetical protein
MDWQELAKQLNETVKQTNELMKGFEKDLNKEQRVLFNKFNTDIERMKLNGKITDVKERNKILEKWKTMALSLEK